MRFTIIHITKSEHEIQKLSTPLRIPEHICSFQTYAFNYNQNYA